MPTPPPAQPAAGFTRRALPIVFLVIALLALWRLRIVLLMAFIAILLALFLRLLADPIARRTGMPEPLAVACALGLIFGVLYGVGALAGNEMAQQFRDLRDRLPAAWTQVQALSARWGAPLDASDLIEARQLEQVAVRALLAANTLLQIAGQTVVVLFGALFLALQPKVYQRGLLAMIPPGRQRARMSAFLDLTGRALRQWLLGQLTSMTIIGVLVSITLMLIGVPGALALGVLTGVAEFVPYVGALSAGLIATLAALSVSPQTALLTLGAYALVQQLEGNLITPLVMRQAVRISPAVNVFALATLAGLFGVAGVFVAVPFAVVTMVAVKYFWIRETLGQATIIPGESSERRRRPDEGNSP